MNDTFTKTDLRRMLAEISATWQPWFIVEEELSLHTIDRIGAAASNLAKTEAETEYPVRYSVRPDGVAVLSINGVLTPKKHGKASYEDIAGLADIIRADDSVKGVVLDIDSPGGMVAGLSMASGAIERLAATKPVAAFTSGLMASAAYWLGTNAHAVIAGPASMTGSVGTVMQHYDLSGLLEKFGVKARVFTNKQADLKGMGSFGVPLTDKQEKYLQERVDELGAQFLAHVKAKRSHVPDSALRGQAVFADRALADGLIDAIGTFEDAIRLVGGRA